jgi:hypothetical protein
VSYDGSSIDTKVVTGTISPGDSINNSVALHQDGTMKVPTNSLVPEFPWGPIAVLPVVLATFFALVIFSKRVAKKH